MSIKIGVTGRVVADPKAAPARSRCRSSDVLKQHGNKVLFSKSYNTTVTIAGADLRATFRK